MTQVTELTKHGFQRLSQRSGIRTRQHAHKFLKHVISNGKKHLHGEFDKCVYKYNGCSYVFREDKNKLVLITMFVN